MCGYSREVGMSVKEKEEAEEKRKRKNTRRHCVCVCVCVTWSNRALNSRRARSFSICFCCVVTFSAFDETEFERNYYIVCPFVYCSMDAAAAVRSNRANAINAIVRRTASHYDGAASSSYPCRKPSKSKRALKVIGSVARTRALTLLQHRFRVHAVSTLYLRASTRRSVEFDLLSVNKKT